MRLRRARLCRDMTRICRTRLCRELASPPLRRYCEDKQFTVTLAGLSPGSVLRFADVDKTQHRNFL